MPAKSRRQQIEEMLEEEPDDPELRYALAMEHVSAGEDSAAVDCFRHLTAEKPEYVPAYFQMAQTLIRLGKPEVARPVIEQGISVARAKGNYHTADELQGLLVGLEEPEQLP
jgi:thioredoxin-like negative regulator of GroEL